MAVAAAGLQTKLLLASKFCYQSVTEATAAHNAAKPNGRIFRPPCKSNKAAQAGIQRIREPNSGGETATR